MMGRDDVEIRGGTSRGLRCLTRRKQVDSERAGGKEGQGQLAKALSIPGLLAIGVGGTIGAGVYVLVGTVARDHTGPALTISFLIAGISAALSALCYAELASRCPSAGSAYHYSYICIGEGVAWIIGWALILEYAIGGSAVARGISPNLALFFGGPDSLPVFLARVKIPWIGIVVDPCAAILVLVVTMILSVGIKESSLVQGIVTGVNVCVMIFVIILGTYLGFKSGWPGYRMTENGYFPFGINGVIAGSATVFFSFIGFDSIASAAEEVKEPQRDLPLGIGLSLSICCGLYMLVSAVIVGIVPYLDMDPDTPISSAFSSLGVEWAMYLVSAGAFTALCATLLGSLLPQPRILMAMARDGLLPPFFSDVNNKTQVPLKGTVASGVCAAILAFLMNVEELAGMVSVGTLLSFTIVAISILILRYIPPDEVPLPSSLQESIHSVASLYNSEQDLVVNQEHTLDAENADDPQSIPLISNKNKDSEQRRRKVATISIAYACVGSLILTSTLSLQHLPHSVQTPLYIGGGLLILGSLVGLYAIDQDDNRHNFGHSGGFICPFVPLLPVCCILINVYLLINLGASTWWKVALWLALGIVIYVFYGRKHSQLVDAVYVPSFQVEQIYRTSLET